VPGERRIRGEFDFSGKYLFTENVNSTKQCVSQIRAENTNVQPDKRRVSRSLGGQARGEDQKGRLYSVSAWGWVIKSKQQQLRREGEGMNKGRRRIKG